MSMTQCPWLEETLREQPKLEDVGCLSRSLLSLPPCRIDISSSVFSAPYHGLLNPFEYWIYCGLVPNSKCLFLDGTMCTFLLQLMLLFPCGLGRRTDLLHRIPSQVK